MQHQWGPAGEFTTQVTEQLSLAYQTLHQLQNIPVTCEKRLKIVKQRQQEIPEEIEAVFKILHEELESKKKQLLRAASSLSEKQLKMLKLHSERSQQQYKLLAAFYEMASEQMADEVSQKPVIVYRECAKKLDQILATFLPKDKTIPVELKVNLALWQAQSQENKAAFNKYMGQVILRPSAQSKDMSIEGKGAERAIAGLPTHFKVVVVPTEGEPLPMLTDDIICSLEPKEGEIVVGTCQRECDGSSCKLTYTPTQHGQHVLKLFLNDVPLEGTPFTVEVGPSLVEMEQKPQLLKQGKKQMKAIAVGKTGQTMALVKSKTCQVKLYSPGKKGKNVGKKGVGDGQFFTPSHAVFTPDSCHFLVTDLGNHRIQKFDLCGQPVAIAGKRGKGDGQFNTPAAIAVDSKGTVYVADLGNNRIQVLTSELGYRRSIPCLTGATPTGLGVDSDGMLYVCYRELHCVQKYHPNGQAMTNFGATQLSRPTCMCVSRLDLVFVGDEGSKSVSVFSSNGDLVHQFGRRGSRTASIQLGRPAGLAVDDENHLYISDAENGRLIKL